MAGFAAGRYLDDRAADIRAHLDACPRCSRWVTEARGAEDLLPGVQDALRAWEGHAAPEVASDQAKDTPDIKLIADSQPPSPKMPAIPGYEFTGKLHRGGQAVVYQAVQKSTKRKVAIKVLLDEQNISDTARKRFEREIELVASLKHPNIIAVFDSGVTPDGRQFCVMDYVHGQNLNEYVQEKKLGLEETLALFGTVCDAVTYAHQKGVIHRDLKPSNILVDAEGQPKVLDFGLAKTIGGPARTAISLTGNVLGTLPYMSPEQTRGNPSDIDIRTDVYALGVILYELLTGHFPYPVAGTIVEVLKHIAETAPTPPTRAWAADSGVTRRSAKRLRRGHCPIDGEIETIVLQALSKDRKRRYQGAGELARDIRHYLAGEPVDAKRDSGLYLLGKILRRHRAPIAITASVVTIIVALVIAATSLAEVRRLRDLHAGNVSLQQATREAAPRGAPIPAEAQSDGTQDENSSREALLEQKADLLLRQGQISTLTAFIDSGNYAGAIAYVDKQLGLTPADAYLVANRGYLWVQQYGVTGDAEHLESARRDYRESMVLDSAYTATAHEGIGNTYYLQALATDADDDLELAIDAYSRAIDIRPGFLRAHSNRGHAYLDARQYARAVADYAIATGADHERLLEEMREDDVWRTYFNYGTALRLLGDSEIAARQYIEAVRAAPEDVYCLAVVALAHLDGHQTADADTWLVKAKAVAEPDTWEGRFIRCLSLDLPPAQLVEAAESDGEKCEAHYYAGEAFVRMGKQEDARREFQQCVEECQSTGTTGFNEYRWARWRLEQAGRTTGND